MFRVARQFGFGQVINPSRISLAHRGITLSARSRAKETPVPYTKDDKTVGDDAGRRSNLSIDGTETVPKAVSSEDVGRSAVGYDKTVAGKLTPTMKMFTLEGKVAVVTGYVSGNSLYLHRLWPAIVFFFVEICMDFWFPLVFYCLAKITAAQERVTSKKDEKIGVRGSWFAKQISRLVVQGVWDGTCPKLSPKLVLKPLLYST